MISKKEVGKWEPASNWREVPNLKWAISQTGYEFAKDGKFMSSKMVSFLDKLFGDKPVEYHDPEADLNLDYPEGLMNLLNSLKCARIYEEGYDKRLPNEYHAIFERKNLYNIVFSNVSCCVGPDLYVRFKEVSIDPKVIQDAIIDGDADYLDDLESTGVKIGKFVYIDDPKQHHINNEDVTIYHYKDNTFLSIGQYGGGINVLIKGKYSLEDIKKWYRWSYENADKLETVGHSVVRLNG